MRITMTLRIMMLMCAIVLMMENISTGQNTQNDHDRIKEKLQAAFRAVEAEGFRKEESFRYNGAALAKFFAIDLGNDEKKPSPKRAVFTKERIAKVFPEFSVASTAPEMERRDYILSSKTNNNLKSCDSSGKVIFQEKNDCFSMYIRLGTRNKNDDKIFSQQFQVQVHYFGSEKESRINMFASACNNSMGIHQMLKRNRILPAPELKIGDICLISPGGVTEKQYEKIYTIRFIRDCTVFIVSGEKQDISLLDIAKRVDKFFTDINAEINK